MRELVRKGKQVRMVNRRGKAPLPAGVQVLKGDTYDPASVRHAARGAAVAYQCARPQYNEWVTLLPKMQSAIIDNVTTRGAKLVVTENLYMYRRAAGPMTEDLPYNADTRKGQTRARMAEQVMEANRSGKLRTTGGPASDFYVPFAHRGSTGERAFYPAIEGRRVDVLGKLDVPSTFTYVNDIGLVTLGADDQALGTAWHVLSAPPFTQRQITTHIPGSRHETSHGGNATCPWQSPGDVQPSRA